METAVPALHHSMEYERIAKMKQMIKFIPI